MAVAGCTINVVTATIAAIAVGVGIDFSTHFTARYLEELQRQPDRLSAVRRAGEGTGEALTLSALTSVLGFAVMAFAPDPIFATFGTLTAVMIGLALVVAIVVLLSTLVMATPRREDQAVAEAESIEVGPWRRRRRLQGCDPSRPPQRPSPRFHPGFRCVPRKGARGTPPQTCARRCTRRMVGQAAIRERGRHGRSPPSPRDDSTALSLAPMGRPGLR
jgi:hypothetical protein